MSLIYRGSFNKNYPSQLTIFFAKYLLVARVIENFAGIYYNKKDF